MENSPEKSSEYVKRVLFGNGNGANGSNPVASKAAVLGSAASGERQGAPGANCNGNNRSGSHSSTSSATGTVVSSTPGTPRHAAGTTSLLHRTPASKIAMCSNNASLAVFLRVRPPGIMGADVDKLSGRRTYHILEDNATLRTFPPFSSTHSRTINRQAKDFGFTRVFGPTAGQKETYNSTMRPLVDDVFASQNGLLFAYGMTNAGKTYTVLGEEESPGLIPQALTDTFERVDQAEGDNRPRVEMSFLEIYIENVYDLLAAADESEWATARNALKLDDRMGVIQARDLSKHVITSAADGLELVRRATANRRVASTKLNEDSSRSHSVCMIKLVRKHGKDSNLWVVDLAGSERSGRTGAGASSTRQKEANNINKGLSTLWHCLTIMRANMRKDEPETRVPFRESKLTHLFKNHLQGPAAGRTVMVVNINPSTEDFDETQTVLKNSTIARDVKTVRDESAAARQNGLLNSAYGFNGRKTQLKKPAGSRRSIHQPVAPKLEALGPPLARKAAQSPVDTSRDDSDCGSTRADEDSGYLSGAESDSGLVDARQSINLVVKNLQVDNEALKAKLKSTLAEKKQKEADSSRGHRPTPGGPLERYIELLEDRITNSETRMEEMRQEHKEEIQELEDELESFLAENGLDANGNTSKAPPFPAESNANAAALVERLQEEVRVANLQADQWKREAETLRTRLEGMEIRSSPASNAQGGTGSPGLTRTPLRQSAGSQGRPSMENRQGADTENSPPGAVKMNVGPPPGGVGSPSKMAARLATPTKAKPSELPSKSSKLKKLSRSPSSKSPSKSPSGKSPSSKSPSASTSNVVAAAPSVAVTPPKPSAPELTTGNGHAAISEKQAGLPPSPPQFPPLFSATAAAESRSPETAASASAMHGGEAVGMSPAGLRVSGEVITTASMTAASPAAMSSTTAAGSPTSTIGGAKLYSPRESGEGGGSGNKMVIAVSRRVSVLRGSTAGSGRRNSSVRSSTPGGRRMSRASVAGKRVSQLRTRTSVAAGMGGALGAADAAAAAERAAAFGDDGYGGTSSRRESAMMAAMAQEDNFFEKARRVLLRAMGVGANKGLAGGRDSISDGNHPVPVSAAEIEAKQKIKVKMPKRPGKKGMEVIPGPLWVADEDEEEEEVVRPAPAETPSSSAVVNGIERWVFGAKDERMTPGRKDGPRWGKPQKDQGGGASPSVSPLRPGDAQSKTIHDYMRAM